MSEHRPSIEADERHIRLRSRAPTTTSNPPSSGFAPTDDRDDANYEVGYGRPPLKTRFQKGRSGNPRGRPKKSESVAELAKAVLNQKHKVTIGGVTQTVTLRKVGVLQDGKKAAAGDDKALERLLKRAGENTGGQTAAGDLSDLQPSVAAAAELASALAEALIVKGGLPEDRVKAALAELGLDFAPDDSGKTEAGHG